MALLLRNKNSEMTKNSSIPDDSNSRIDRSDDCIERIEGNVHVHLILTLRTTPALMPDISPS